MKSLSSLKFALLGIFVVVALASMGKAAIFRSLLLLGVLYLHVVKDAIV